MLTFSVKVRTIKDMLLNMGRFVNLGVNVSLQSFACATLVEHRFLFVKSEQALSAFLLLSIG